MLGLATYNNQKTTPGQDVHKFYPFQPLFLAYWEFQKCQTKVTNFAPGLGGPSGECFQFQGLFRIILIKNIINKSNHTMTTVRHVSKCSKRIVLQDHTSGEGSALRKYFVPT